MNQYDELNQQELARQRTAWAFERTQLAATRTYFALLRTGLAIAAGGTLVTTLLGTDWPDWITGTLAAVFIVVGFWIMIIGLKNYNDLIQELAVEGKSTTISVKLLVALTIILLLAVVAVLILFLFA